jgi:hypothetical protein
MLPASLAAITSQSLPKMAARRYSDTTIRGGRQSPRTNKRHMFLDFGLSTVAPKQSFQTAPQTMARRKKK